MMGWRARVLLTALWLVGRAYCAEAEAAKNEETSPWDTSVSLRGGAGYKNNVLLSDFNRESSVFTLSSADFFIFHVPVNGWEFSSFLTAEDRRYWESPSLDKEQLFLLSSDLKRNLGERWKAGLNLQYFYSDQVFDASLAEGLPFRVQAKLHRFSGGPTAQVVLPGKRRIEIAGIVTRQSFEEPLDDSWELGPKLIFGQKFGYGSDLTVTLAWRDRTYDTRATPDFGSLRYRQFEPELGLKYYWDEEKHWNSRTRAGLEVNRDNGAGVFDYNKWRLSQELGFTKSGFLASLQGKLLHYEYTTQRGFGRRRSEVTVVARVEQEVFRKLKLFAEYEHEWVSATDLSERYRATTFTAGLEWEVK
jgi:hypothetical protein